MNLVERHIIKKSDTRYKELDNICFLSKNLYNATLYAFRQHYFNTEEFLGYLSLNKEFVLSDNPDYRALPSKVSQATMKIVENNYKSFFALKKKGEKDAEANFLQNLKGGIKAKIAKDLTDSQQREITK